MPSDYEDVLTQACFSTVPRPVVRYLPSFSLRCFSCSEISAGFAFTVPPFALFPMSERYDGAAIRTLSGGAVLRFTDLLADVDLTER